MVRPSTAKLGNGWPDTRTSAPCRTRRSRYPDAPAPPFSPASARVRTEAPRRSSRSSRHGGKPLWWAVAVEWWTKDRSTGRRAESVSHWSITEWRASSEGSASMRVGGAPRILL